jgi:hypothetical protein
MPVKLLKTATQKINQLHPNESTTVDQQAKEIAGKLAKIYDM